MDFSSHSQILVLAGGGHTHALMLRKWAINQKLKPNGLIILVSKHSRTLYSGMLPGLISGIYDSEDLEIDLQRLCSKCNISFIRAEIVGLEIEEKKLILANRAPLSFTHLSLNIGAISKPWEVNSFRYASIKPLETALNYINNANLEEQEKNNIPFTIIGSGLTAVEVCFALRKRWLHRPLQLQAKKNKNTIQPFLKELKNADIHLISTNQEITGPALLCNGSRPPEWLTKSGLPINKDGRIRTDRGLRVLDHPNLFAVGDCAVVDTDQRPPSGVWAVKAARTLIENIKRQQSNKKLIRWKPQRQALQLVGGFNKKGEPIAWAIINGKTLGPTKQLWSWKRFIDRRFMQMFNMQQMVKDDINMACRGCAAKLPAINLENALSEAGMEISGRKPEDAALLDAKWVQSVDGFPALISDPWLNARITTLHSCSDIWACGQRVHSAQLILTLPEIDKQQQEWLMSQTLLGVKSALNEQNAQLLGGHTLVARDQSPTTQAMGIQLAITVNGQKNQCYWSKGGLIAGNVLLLSRPLGTGVIMAAAMKGAAKSKHVEQALNQMATSQHNLLDQLLSYVKNQPKCINSCTDITGFGLLGHLQEMLNSSSKDIYINLKAEAIPNLPGSLELLAAGYQSTLAPYNRSALRLLDARKDCPAKVRLTSDQLPSLAKKSQALLELLVDPQTCGPLLLSCDKLTAKDLCQNGPWINIGEIFDHIT